MLSEANGRLLENKVGGVHGCRLLHLRTGIRMIGSSFWKTRKKIIRSKRLNEDQRF